MTRKLTVVDLFAGAGGLSLGFEQTGMFEIKYAVEINHYARQTYCKNHDSIKNLFTDIKDVNYEDIRNNDEIDIVIGGPPCQGFSNANRQKNDLISGNNYLVNEFIRAIEKLRPKAFVMENVKTITSPSHKFFVTNERREELERLNIKFHHNEEISVGKVDRCSSTLLELIRNEEIPLKPFFLDKEVFSKLHSLYRCRKNRAKLNKYLFKNQKYFAGISDDCMKYHTAKLSDDYAQMWRSMSKLLVASIQSGDVGEELLQTIDSILEMQRMLLKVDEVRHHNISYRVKDHDNEVFLEVTTYNVFEYVEQKLKSLKYDVDSDVLKALQFGVPQHRERMFIVGVREDCIRRVDDLLPTPFLTSSTQYYTIQEAIGDLELADPDINPKAQPAKKPVLVDGEDHDNLLRTYLCQNETEIKNHIITNTTPVAMQRFKVLTPGQSFHDLSDDQKSTYSDPARTQKTVYHRLEYNKPSRTVVNVRKSMWIHPTQDRAISIREAARLQSFPDSYEFIGTKDAQYQQIGNAVPPLLGRAVAEQLLRVLGHEVAHTLKGELYRPATVEQSEQTTLLPV